VAIDWSVPTHSRAASTPTRPVSDRTASFAWSPPGLDDVGRAELADQLLALRVAAERDDPLGAEPVRRELATQTDGAVADHRDRGARPGSGREGRVVTRRHDVGEREQGRDLRRVRFATWHHHQGRVRVRHPDGLALTAVGAWLPPEPALGTRRVKPVGAVGAGPVGPNEWCDHEVAGLDGADRGAGLLDHADELMADPLTRLAGRHAAIGPQVTAADAGGDDAHHGIGRFLDHRVRDRVQPDVARSVDGGRTHDHQPTGAVAGAGPGPVNCGLRPYCG
jgi:hypothetical protein